MLSRLPGSSTIFFVCQIIFLITTTCLIPTFTYWLTKRRQRVVHVMIESLLFTVLFAGFGLWLFGTLVVRNGIIYIVTLVLILEAGSNFVEWQKESILKRLSGDDNFKNLKTFAESIEKMFSNELILYIFMPLGIVIGASVGLIFHWTAQATAGYCLQSFLLLTSCVLIYFLTYSFRRMCEPMFKTAQIVTPEIVVKKPKGLWRKIFQVLVPSPTTEAEDQEKQDIDLACNISDLRKIYKYDSLHNTILLVTSVAFILRLRGIAIDGKWLITFLLTTTFLLTEMPYGVGQYLLHKKVLERFTGAKHVEVAKKLNDDTPVFSSWPILTTLATSGTAGGFLYFIFDQFMQNTLKDLLK